MNLEYDLRCGQSQEAELWFQSSSEPDQRRDYEVGWAGLALCRLEFSQGQQEQHLDGNDLMTPYWASIVGHGSKQGAGQSDL